MKLRINNLIKLVIMLELARGPAHGYGLMRDAEERLGRKPSAAQIYPFLQLLERKKLIAVSKSGAREKTTYSLTPKGRKFVNGLMNRFGGLIDIAVEPKLTACAHCGCKIFGGGHEETIKGKKLVFCCCHCAESFKRSG
ncbi:MAG: PadR family transcriptional regulator [Candidatus Micrarchaeota archaeon]